MELENLMDIPTVDTFAISKALLSQLDNHLSSVEELKDLNDVFFNLLTDSVVTKLTKTDYEKLFIKLYSNNFIREYVKSNNDYLLDLKVDQGIDTKFVSLLTAKISRKLEKDLFTEIFKHWSAPEMPLITKISKEAAFLYSYYKFSKLVNTMVKNIDKLEEVHLEVLQYLYSIYRLLVSPSLSKLTPNLYPILSGREEELSMLVKTQLEFKYRTPIPNL